MNAIKLDRDNLESYVSDDEIARLQGDVSKIHEAMEAGRSKGSDYLGWLHLPSSITGDVLDDIKERAHEVREMADVFVSIGIGGSYLGAKAAIEFVTHTFNNQLKKRTGRSPEIYFAGQNISSDYLADLFDVIEEKDICLNVISKSGTTTEPAIAFRLLKEKAEQRYGRKEARKRIIATTDSSRGALKKLAHEEGYKTFVIPDDVGGRYSVLTPVGLLPIAVAGIDIGKLVSGAAEAEKSSADAGFESNLAYRYAAIRNILYQKGKTIEILSSFHPSLHFVAEWWKQLAGESEGKEGKSLFPASVDLTTDLHSMGQWIQEGNRIIFETFMTIEKSNREITIPKVDDDLDGLNYIAGKSLDFVNDKAHRGTAMAHRDGGVPNMTLSLKDRSPETLGQLFYFFERAVAMSGYLLGVNPFDQPGVEFYKKNMFSLLGK
ncbi:MAG: glucose-6-phosphate isomerase [Deltaproteobacteria bacterium]|nr:glucose-6-phosphate isomerase [Deltaproteobacteria bacterium]